MAIRIGKIYTDFSPDGKIKYISYPYMQSSISENLRSFVYSTNRAYWYAMNISKNEKMMKVRFTSEEARETFKSLFRTDWSDEFE